MPGTAVSNPDDGVVVVDYKANAADAVPRSCCGQEEQNPSPKPEPIEQLLTQLRGAFDAEKAAGYVIDNQQDPASFTRLNNKVQELLKAYACSGGDWRRFALFNDLHYVRNLVEANDDFELIVLCWKGGQVSRVHNHAASHCWLAILDGEMREVQYQLVGGGEDQPAAPAAADPEAGSSGAVCVEATHTTDMKVGDVGYINDHLALHTVGCYMTPEQLEAHNAGCSGSWTTEGGVTLHLYSPPIRRVKIYEYNGVTERIPGYYSKGGVRV